MNATREDRIKEAEKMVASLRDNSDAEFIVAVGGEVNGKGIGLGISLGMSLNGLASLAAWIFREMPLKAKIMLQSELKEEIEKSKKQGAKNG